jgi:hypothetical protein
MIIKITAQVAKIYIKTDFFKRHNIIKDIHVYWEDDGKTSNL